MKKSAILLAVLVLAGCQSAHTPAPMAPPPSQPATPPVPPKTKTPLPPVRSAGPLAKADIGVYMDAVEADLREYLRAQHVPVARRGDTVTVTVESARIFDHGAVSNWGDAYLRVLAQVLGHFDHTDADITGYTGSQGDAARNQAQSEAQAKALAAGLTGYHIAASRLKASGLGATAFRDANGTDKRNWRLEIKITPVPNK